MGFSYMKFIREIILILAFFVVISPGSAAPGDIIWQQTFGGLEEEWGYSLDTYPDGGIIATGVTYSNDTNISGYHGNGDLWAVRLDPNGMLIWERAYGGNESDYGLSVKHTSDGGSIIIGTTGSNNGDVTGYHGNGDLWLVRLSPSGEMVWEKTYGGNLTDEGGDIVQTPDGGYMMVGYSMSIDGDVTGNHGRGDLWMIKIDQTGKIIWQKCLGGSKRDSGSSIILTSDGGYVMTGNSYSSDGNATGNHGSSDVWVVKIDLNGTLLWQKTYGGSKLDWGHSVTELPGGDLMVTGITSSSDGDISMNHGAGDIWILRLTPDGELIWEETYGGSFSDNIWNIKPSPNGGAYLVGETFSVDGEIRGNHGDADIWVAEIDGDGTLLWDRCLGGSNYESGSWITQLSDGNLVVTGTTQSRDGDVTGSHGGGDLWTVKIDARLPAELKISQIAMTVPVLNTTLVTTITTNLSDNLTLIQIPVQNVTPSLPALSVVITTTQGTPVNTSSLVNLTLSSLPGSILIPGDPDGDGRFEDLNGNGKIDLQDTTAFFTYFEWIQKNEPASGFDFNRNGVIDFGDINALFTEASL